MKKTARLIKLLLVFVLLSVLGCAGQPKLTPTAPSDKRDRLTFKELTAKKYSGRGSVHNGYFMPIGQWRPAIQELRGTLTVSESSMKGNIWKENKLKSAFRYFPGFSVQFFTYEDYLVPVTRDIIHSTEDNPRSFWTLILSPGRAWSEPGDNGMSRASFPFVLASVYSNESHNGIATFLYDDARISFLRLQVVQETASWRKRNYWGQIPMTYTPGPIANQEAVVNQFVHELQYETPIHPWSELKKFADAELLENFNGAIDPQDISAAGLIADNKIYLQFCNTRYGAYPYPRYMRHGVFSVTKSMGAAIAMLRLAQKYGDDVFKLKIKDYLTVTASHNGWDNVTFGDCLNMATGIGDNWPKREPNNISADENKEKMGKWSRARTAQEKLDVSFSYGNYPWGPGGVLRYNSTQTFVLATAMDSYLKSKEGPQANLWDMVIKEVLNPIGIFHAPMMHTRETDGSRGIPHLATGFYPTIDDTAKITILLQNAGNHHGRQILSETKLTEALYRTGQSGFSTDRHNGYGDGRYNMSFWSVPYQTPNGCFFQIPYMAGYGGNLVVLLPNGISAFRFADGHHFDPESLVLGAEAIRPLSCENKSVIESEDDFPACEVPFPEDLVIETPNERVPEEMARFSGIWHQGKFGGQLCTALAVKSIEETGAASVVLSWGVQEFWRIDEPGFSELPAIIEDGRLVFDLRVGWFSRTFGINIGKLSYWFAGNKLRGAFVRPNMGIYVTLTKME